MPTRSSSPAYADLGDRSKHSRQFLILFIRVSKSVGIRNPYCKWLAAWRHGNGDRQMPGGCAADIPVAMRNASWKDDQRTRIGGKLTAVNLYVHLAFDNIEYLINLMSVKTLWRPSSRGCIDLHYCAVNGAAVPII